MKLTVTRRARWELFQLMGLIKFGEPKKDDTTIHLPADLATIKAYNRLWLAMALGRIAAALDVAAKKTGRIMNNAVVLDAVTEHAVEVGDHSVELFLTKLVPTITVGYQARFLGPLIDQAEVWKTTGTAPVVPESVQPIPDEEEWTTEDKSAKCEMCRQPLTNAVPALTNGKPEKEAAAAADPS